MASIGKPSLPRVKLDPRTGLPSQRDLDQLVDNIGERFRALEAQNVAATQSAAQDALASLESQVGALRASLAALGNQIGEAIALAQSFQSVGNGVMVKQGELIITRNLLPGFSIDIENQDAQDGDPVVIFRPDPAPDATELAITGHAPEVRVGLMIEVPAGSLTATGEAPAVV